MAFLRFSRDKRGYEHFSLLEPTTNRRGKSRSRLLYWYRTPPNVKVGREPFDESVRDALEAQNPDVRFDWRKIVETPIPSAETERWRERRRAEKTLKSARRASVQERPAESESASAVELDEAAPDLERDEIDSEIEPDTSELGAVATDEPSTAEAGKAEDETNSEAAAAPTRGELPRRRRRRRGRRGRHGRDARGQGQSPPVPHQEPPASAVTEIVRDEAGSEPEGE